MNISELLSRFNNVKKLKENSYQVSCPIHGEDKKPSLTITEGNDKFLLNCKVGCETEKIVQAVGLEMKDLFKDDDLSYQSNNKSTRNSNIQAIYPYVDLEGNILFEKVRFKEGKGKFRHTNNEGNIIWSISKGTYYETFEGSGEYSSKKEKNKNNKTIEVKKSIERILYNLPALSRAIKENETVFICEGEKDVDNLGSLGLVGTCNFDGAGKKKFKKSYVKYFINADVVIIPDDDQAGEHHTQNIINNLLEYASSIKVVKLPNVKNKKGFDLTDYLEIGHTKEEFLKLVDEAKKEHKKSVVDGDQPNDTGNKETDCIDNYTTQDSEGKGNAKPDWYEFNENTGKPKLVPGLLASYLAENIPSLYSTGRFYLYENGVYNICNFDEEKTLVMEHIIPRCRTMKDINDITSQWSINPKVRVSSDRLDTDLYTLNLKDGLYNINTRELKEHDPKILSTIQMNVKYLDNSEGKAFTKFIHEAVPDEDNRLLVQEMLGYSLTSFNNAKKMFILNGKGDTGKSTFLNIIEDMVTNKYVSNVTLQKLGDRFNTAELFGKLVNIFADLPSTPIKDGGLMKVLTGTDTVQAERKGKDPFNFYNKAKMIFSCNELPANYGDKSDAFYNRLIIIPFNNSVPKEKQDPLLRDKLNKELSFIFKWGMEGLERLMSNKFVFTENQATKLIVENYKLNSNTVLMFCNEHCEVGEGNIVSSTALFNEYKEYCNVNGFKPLNANNFKSELESNFKEVEKKGRIPGTEIRAFKGIKIVESLLEEEKKPSMIRGVI